MSNNSEDQSTNRSPSEEPTLGVQQSVTAEEEAQEGLAVEKEPDQEPSESDTLGCLQSKEVEEEEGQTSPGVEDAPDEDPTESVAPEEEKEEHEHEHDHDHNHEEEEESEPVEPWVQPTGDDLRSRLAIITNDIQYALHSLSRFTTTKLCTQSCFTTIRRQPRHISLTPKQTPLELQ